MEQYMMAADILPSLEMIILSAFLVLEPFPRIALP